MAWEEVAPERWLKIETDEVEGYFLGLSEDTTIEHTPYVVRLQLQNSEVVKIIASTDLRHKLKTVSIGTKIKIVPAGTVKTEKGHLKVFRVYQDKADTIEPF